MTWWTRSKDAASCSRRVGARQPRRIVTPVGRSLNADKSDVGIQQMVSVCKALSQTGRLCDHRFTCGHRASVSRARSRRTVLIVTTADVSALCDADKVIYLLERVTGRPAGLKMFRYTHCRRDGELRDIDDILDILPSISSALFLSTRALYRYDRGQPIALNRPHYVSQAYHNAAQRGWETMCR